MYDIIYIKAVDSDRSNYESFKKRYPFSKLVEYVDIHEAIAKAASKSFTNMFWIVEDGAEIQGDLNRKVSNYDINYLNGKVYLLTKKIQLTADDIDSLFVNRDKTDLSIIAQLQPINTYDMFFISYNEANADLNYENLLSRFPKAKRINGIKGIHQAHREAARQSSTDYFWVIDGDSKIVESFNFDFILPINTADTVFVWRSINPVNDLEYGYGGVKLLPKKKMLDLKDLPVDMTTSITGKIETVSEISNYTMFNTDPFSAWRSAFRECVKLSSKVIPNQVDEDTESRLEIWCTRGSEKQFGELVIKGALMGREYGLKNKDNPEALSKINDWEWLEDAFKRS